MSPPAPAAALPRAAYFRPDWFAAEQERIFARSWLFAGLAADAPAEGGYWTLEAGPCPLLLTRSGGVLRAFHNRCRHRGAKLVEGRGAARLITCFYHRWCYQLDGRLRGIPDAQRFPEEARALGLETALVAEWNGLLFVNADAQAEPFEAWLGDAGAFLAPWPAAALTPVHRATHMIRANWKLFLENHIDGYHLAHLHRDSIDGLDHAAQRWTASGRHWLFFEPLSRPGIRPPFEPAGFPAIRQGGADGMGSTAWKLFPTFAGAGGESFVALLNVVPLAPAQTRVDVMVLAGQASPLARAWAGTKAALSRTPDVLAEDVRAVEAIQGAIGAPGWREGPLARGWEDAIGVFRSHVAALIGEGAPGD